jgi:uncharacterized protein
LEGDMPDTAVMQRAMHEKPVDMNEGIIRFFRKRPEVVAVYLFGSRARGRATEISDVDLAILLDPEVAVDSSKLKSELLIGLSRILRKEIHLVILNLAGEMLTAQVFQYGRCLYNADPHTLSRFRTTQFSRIADFTYLRKIMEKGFTRKIMEGAR